MSEAEWVESRMIELVAEYGAVPPPWFMFPDTHPYSLFWRMGDGEGHLEVFDAWWAQQKDQLDEGQRVDYFRQWPPPPRWITWMLDVIWDIEPWESDDPDPFDYAPYFARSEALGFGTQAEFKRDINDPQWLEE